MNKLIAYLRSSDFRRNLLISVLSISFFILILSLGLGIYTRHGDGLLVPNVMGMPLERAVQALESQELKCQIDSVFVSDKAPGTVLEQDPDASTNVKSGRTIYLTVVTRQAPTSVFPDISGKTFLEAQAILLSQGFKLGDTTYTSGVSRDMVLSASLLGQPMTRGEALHKGSRIDLILGDGKGASEVDIPNLIGLNLSEARMALLGSSLSLGEVSPDLGDESSTAKVIRQDPMPSDTLSKVRVGTRIDVVLSK